MSKALKVMLIILAVLAVLITGLFFLLRARSFNQIMDGPGMEKEPVRPVLVLGRKTPDTLQDVYMEAVRFDRDAGVLTLHIVNNSDLDFSFGREYRLYEKTDGKWVRLMPPPDWAVPAEEIVVSAHTDGGADCDLTIYMEPDSGQYKIAIENLEAEFNLEWTE